MADNISSNRFDFDSSASIQHLPTASSIPVITSVYSSGQQNPLNQADGAACYILPSNGLHALAPTPFKLEPRPPGYVVQPFSIGGTTSHSLINQQLLAQLPQFSQDQQQLQQPQLLHSTSSSQQSSFLAGTPQQQGVNYVLVGQNSDCRILYAPEQFPSQQLFPYADAPKPSVSARNMMTPLTFQSSSIMSPFLHRSGLMVDALAAPAPVLTPHNDADSHTSSKPDDPVQGDLLQLSGGQHRLQLPTAIVCPLCRPKPNQNPVEVPTKFMLAHICHHFQYLPIQCLVCYERFGADAVYRLHLVDSKHAETYCVATDKFLSRLAESVYNVIVCLQQHNRNLPASKLGEVIELKKMIISHCKSGDVPPRLRKSLSMVENLIQPYLPNSSFFESEPCTSSAVDRYVVPVESDSETEDQDELAIQSPPKKRPKMEAASPSTASDQDDIPFVELIHDGVGGNNQNDDVTTHESQPSTVDMEPSAASSSSLCVASPLKSVRTKRGRPSTKSKSNHPVQTTAAPQPPAAPPSAPDIDNLIIASEHVTPVKDNTELVSPQDANSGSKMLACEMKRLKYDDTSVDWKIESVKKGNYGLRRLHSAERLMLPVTKQSSIYCGMDVEDEDYDCDVTLPPSLVDSYDNLPNMEQSMRSLSPELERVKNQTKRQNLDKLHCFECSDSIDLEDDAILEHVIKSHMDASVILFRCQRCQFGAITITSILSHHDTSHKDMRISFKDEIARWTGEIVGQFRICFPTPNSLSHHALRSYKKGDVQEPDGYVSDGEDEIPLLPPKLVIIKGADGEKMQGSMTLKEEPSEVDIPNTFEPIDIDEMLGLSNDGGDNAETESELKFLDCHCCDASIPLKAGRIEAHIWGQHVHWAPYMCHVCNKGHESTQQRGECSTSSKKAGANSHVKSAAFYAYSIESIMEHCILMHEDVKHIGFVFRGTPRWSQQYRMWRKKCFSGKIDKQFDTIALC